MCTAIILVSPGGGGRAGGGETPGGVGEDLPGVAPVVVAANRDEFYRRPADGPVVIDAAGGAVGGVDRQQGGSWLGVTPDGFLALLTNQPRSGGPLPDRRSRGELVVEVLRRGRTDAARRWLEDLDPRAYNRFNLLYGDAGRLEVAYGRDTAEVEFEAVPAGLSVLPNGRLNQPGHPKVVRARALMAPHSRVAKPPPRSPEGAPRLARSWPELACSLCGVLVDHHLPDLADLPADAGSRFSPETRQQLGALCIHTPDYGTRSAAVVALEPGRVAHYLWAPGPPCTTRFDDATSLFPPR